MPLLIHLLLLALTPAGEPSVEPVTSALPRARTQLEPRPVDELRLRLRARPAPERERLERHLSEFEGLTPAERAKLLQRARMLREREQALARIEAQARPAERQTHLRDEIRAQGGEVRRRLPEKLQKRLEQAGPEERRWLLERLAHERERISRDAIEAMRERLQLAPHEVRRLERLPVEARLRAMRELSGAARARPRAESRTRPPGG